MFGEKSRQIAALEQVNTQLTAQMTEAKPYLELAKQINAEVQASITSISEDSAALQLRLDEVISNLTTDLQVKTFMDLLADLPPEKKYTLLSNAFSNPIFDTALAIVQDKMQKKLKMK